MRSKAAKGPTRKSRSSRDRDIVRRVCIWFAGAARDLPWRKSDPSTGRRDPYASLVSEFMLQQTQVSRVLEKFDAFLASYPTAETLAQAELSEVLAAWSGLGYYRRARNLHAAAKAVVGEFNGTVPADPKHLMTLPGIGRYTAGAIASMVYGRPEPLVDGNVARVLLRVEGRRLDQAAGVQWAWTRAEELIQVSAAAIETASPGLFNEGLMELGATVCTPSSPRCPDCPLATLCQARKQGLQDQIPQPKAKPRRATIIHSSILVRDQSGRILVERRPETGLWASMWQAPTLESSGKQPPKKLAAWLGVPSVRRLGEFVHNTTHRHVQFTVWDGGIVKAVPSNGAERQWVKSVHRLAMGNAQRRVIEMAHRTEHQHGS
jgi:A/G-specific adenine glycosylase